MQASLFLPRGFEEGMCPCTKAVNAKGITYDRGVIAANHVTERVGADVIANRFAAQEGRAMPLLELSLLQTLPTATMHICCRRNCHSRCCRSRRCAYI